MKPLTLGIVIVVALGAVWYMFSMNGARELTRHTIESFEECAARYPIMESYPERCTTPDGKSFTRDIGNELEKIDLIRVDVPHRGEVVRSPLLVSGQARGTWFFEASFPVRLLDGNGKEIAIAPGTAEGEWMTEEFVPFSVELTFEKPQTTHGTLILQKDNPSGLPENEDSLIVPIRF